MSSLDVRAIEEQSLKKAPSPKVVHGYRVFLSEEAFDRAVERGASDTSREVGGILVGELLRDDAGPYLQVEATVDALHAEEKGAELTFTHATWEHINKEMDTRYKGKQIVGWYHTHPGFGIFLSDRDQFIHKSFFNLPFQVAFVYDPKSREHGMFTWHDNEVVRARRYWIGQREQLWDGARVALDPRRDKEQPRDTKVEPKREAAAEELPLGMAGLIVIGAMVLLIGGFVGHWLASWSASRDIEAARIEIAKAKQEGAQLAMSALQSDLVGLLRDTLGDQAMRKPVITALAEIDAALAATQPPASGSAAGSAAGSASPPATSDDRMQRIVAAVKTLRESLTRLAQDRGSAQATLNQLERMAAQNGDARDSARDVAEQRAGLGQLYAELAADVAKGGDKARARRLLITAAHLDPGNRARYENQLQSFDKSAHLPVGESAGSGGTR